MTSKEPTSIKVFCRFRPYNSKQLSSQEQPTKLHRISKEKQLIIKNVKQQELSFMFDKVFDMDSTQESVFQQVGRPVLKNILDGFNGTIMAYGQTSSGKTHTMQGYDFGDRNLKGIMPRIIEELFSWIEKSPQCIEYKLKVSIFELYLQKVRDLLDVSKNDLKIREGRQGPYVGDLTQVYVGDKIDLFKLIQRGQKNRTVCSTNMNDSSSRSHMIFLLSLNQFNTIDSCSKTSKLFLIDLAGSEKISKTGAQGKILQEAKKINLSLTCLGKVIKSLSEQTTKGSHIPYRDSKLTRIIKDSLGGNSKTTLIVTCSPHQIHLPQTISTLRFGQNAQKIKNKPKINKELTVQQLQKIIERMEGQMLGLKRRIMGLEKYIVQDLKAGLPANVDLKQEDRETIIKDEQKQLQSLQVNNTEMEQERQYSQPIQPDLHFTDEILKLQQQILSYQKTIQRQTKKLQKLRIQYSEMHENMKQLLKENLQLQQKLQEIERQTQIIQEFEDESQKIKRNMKEMGQKQIETLKLILGNIFSVLGEEMEQKLRRGIQGQFWYQKIIVEGEECTQFWRKEKDEVNRQMEELTTTYLNLNSLKKNRCQDNISIIDKSQSFSINAQLLISLSNQSVIMDTKQQYESPPTQRITLPPPIFKSSPRLLPLQTDTFTQLNIQKLLSDHQSAILHRQNTKLTKLQSKLDKLYQDYHEMIKMQTVWKVQCQLYERKLKIKQEKIKKLEGVVEEMEEKVQIMRGEKALDWDNDTISIRTKIVKPLRGGLMFRY